MSDTIVRQRILILLVMGVISIGVWLPRAGAADARQPTELLIHFLDVGQGDATLFEAPNGVQVLIDGGPDSSVLRALGKVLPWGDRTIDVVIATHQDSDHISGLVDVLERFSVGTIITTANTTDTPTATAFAAAVAAEGATHLIATAGQVLQLDDELTLAVLFPVDDAADMNTNASSIVTQLLYRDVAVVVTGDAPQYIEEYLVGAYGADLRSDILKVGHHGSKTSTAETFVSAVAPTYAVISAAADNPYGHPHQEVLDTLAVAEGITVLGTYDEGTITFRSDGDTIWRE